MPLSDIVRVTISTESAQVTQAGFGVPLILGTSQVFPDRIRFYTGASELLDDGFAPESAEYRMAVVLMSQNPRPPRFAIGRRVMSIPTLSYDIIPNVLNSHRYTLKVDGVEVAYTSDATATAAEIATGIRTALGTIGGGMEATVVGTTVRYAQLNTGDYNAVENTDTVGLRVFQSHPSTGVEVDLADIANVDNSWYVILNAFNSDAEIGVISAYAEANGKLFIAQTMDSAVINTLVTGATDIAAVMASMSRARTAIIYHPSAGAFADAAWASRCLPLDPGSESWKFKTLSGVPYITLNASQLTNLKAKRANYYYAVGGIGMTADGRVSANEWIDVVRGRDWIVARIQEGVYGLLASAKKVPMTREGITLIDTQLRARLQEGVDVGLFADDPAPWTRVPKPADISVNDRAARVLRPVQFGAVLSGAIHEIELTGTITV